MGLKIETETVHIVDCFDLDRFLTKRFEFEEAYEFVAAEVMGNDSVKSLNVNKRELGSWDNKDLETMISTKKWKKYETVLLLCYLCKLDEIPEGRYMIEVCW